jgi:hypothetical protein
MSEIVSEGEKAGAGNGAAVFRYAEKLLPSWLVVSVVL